MVNFDNIADATGIGFDEADYVKTHETFEDFKNSRKAYAEAGEISEGTVDGVKYLLIEKAQITKGTPRKNIVVVDFGDFRMVAA